jgi:glycosyltransferase involved in cell wall biosynthesis
VSVVIPALNEAENLPFVLPAIPEWVTEVVLVDGLSTDGTSTVARQILPDVRIVEQQGRGKGAALRSGLEAARGDIVVMLDADGSTDPHEIPAFVDALVAGADFAKGSRFLPGGGTSDMTRFRQFGNAAFVLLVRTLYGGNYTDLCYGYNAVWRRNIDSLSLDCNGFEIETLMNIRALKSRMRVAEVPSFEHSRIHGNSNLNAFRDGWRVLRTILGEFWTPSRRVLPSDASDGASSATIVPVPMAARNSSPAAPVAALVRSDMHETHLVNKIRQQLAATDAGSREAEIEAGEPLGLKEPSQALAR